MLRLAFAGRRRQLAAANPCRKPRFAARFPANQASYINNAVAAALSKLAFPFWRSWWYRAVC